MRTILTLLLALLFCSLYGQDYRPLHDSVYTQFNVPHPLFQSTYGPNFIQLYPVFDRVETGDSIFKISDHCENSFITSWPLGDEFVRHQEPHKFSFNRHGDSVILRTDYEQGKTWSCIKIYAQPQVNATFVDKQLYTFNGITDSVLVIKIGTDDTVRISKHYGLCRFPNFYSFRDYNAPYLKDTLVLTYLSNTPVQQAVYKPKEVFQYNQGEVLYYKQISWQPTNYSAQKLIVDAVTTDGDTTWYDFTLYYGLYFTNGPYTIKLKVTPYAVTETSNSHFFPWVSEMFERTSCAKNYVGLSNIFFSITKTLLDEDPDDDYYYVTAPEMGYGYTMLYDTDHGFFGYYINAFMSKAFLQECVGRFPTDDPQNDANMTDLIISANTEKVSDQLQVYPNPCADQLYISELPTANYQVEVSLSSGVSINNIQHSYQNNGLLINTSSLSSGVYFLKISNGNDVMMKMFVKQ